MIYRYQLLNGEVDGKQHFYVVDLALNYLIIASSSNVDEMLDFIEKREEDDVILTWKQG